MGKVRYVERSNQKEGDEDIRGGDEEGGKDCKGFVGNGDNKGKDRVMMQAAMMAEVMEKEVILLRSWYQVNYVGRRQKGMCEREIL